ncbi:hypothetical protein [Pseudomonas sp. UMAB-40]|uniref:hypothetical protein n=1 Tax=Pseudomonas sp. UMAB-40 TaxID=1365407 RepID=UPI001C560F52|nr:hypothetical protein [Pseudomonas sp. UMAB-40]
MSTTSPGSNRSPTEDAPAHLSKLSPQQAQLYELVTAIWPSAPSSELAGKATLSELVRLASSDELPSDRQAQLILYLYAIPGYGLTGAEEEVERHHGVVLAFLQREVFIHTAAGAKAATTKTTAERFTPRTRWNLCQTLSGNWRLIANAVSLLLFVSMLVGLVRGFFSSPSLDLDELTKTGVLAVAVAVSARCAKHVGAVAGYKLALLDGPTPPLPLLHTFELVALSAVAFAGSLLAPKLWESSTVEMFLYLTSTVAMITAAGAVGPRKAKSIANK